MCWKIEWWWRRETLFRPPHPFLQAFGQIFEDDMIGFPSSSDICFMAFTSSAKRISQEGMHVFSKVAASIQPLYLLSCWLVRRLSRWAPIKVMRKIAAKKQLHTVLPQSRQSARLFLQSSELGPPNPSPQASVSPPFGSGGEGFRTFWCNP